MRRVIRYVVSLGSFAGLWTDAVTAEVATSYDLIPQKNVFKLREPVVELPPTNRIEPVRMTLIGISTLGARKLAFLKPTAGPAAARQGAAAATADQTIMLAVGERQGDIEVVDIDAAAGRVMIRQAGELVNVVFEKEAPRSNPPANVAGEPGAAQPNPNPPGG